MITALIHKGIFLQRCQCWLGNKAIQSVGVSGLVVTSIRLLKFRLRVWISPRAICKQPWASCQPTVWSGQLSLLPFAGRKMSSSLRAMGWRSSVADWGGGCQWYVCAASRVQLFVSTGNGWQRDATRYQWLLPISCHFQDCRVLLVMSLTHVSSATASIRPLPLPLKTGCSNPKASPLGTQPNPK